RPRSLASPSRRRSPGPPLEGRFIWTPPLQDRTMTTLEDKARRFAELHSAPGIIVLPNAWDVGSAVIMADAGFPAVATTSAGVAFAQGLPVGERISKQKMLEIA